MKRRISRLTLSLFALGGLCLMLAGCPATMQGKLNQVEIVYGNTLGELNELHAAGRISDDVYHTTVAPSARAAYAGIKQARAQIKAGTTSGVEVILKSINDALLKMQEARPVPPAGGGQTSNLRATVPPVQEAVIDPVTASLMIGLGLRAIAAGEKLFKGDALTDEEQALVQQTTDAAAAEMEAQDAKIRNA